MCVCLVLFLFCVFFNFFFFFLLQAALAHTWLLRKWNNPAYIGSKCLSITTGASSQIESSSPVLCHNSLNTSFLWCHQPQSSRTRWSFSTKSCIYISQNPEFLFVMLPATFLQTAQVPLWLTVTYLSLHQLPLPTHSSPWETPSFLHSGIYVSFWRLKVLSCTVPSVCFIPPGHRDFVTLPFLSQESYLSLCLPSPHQSFSSYPSFKSWFKYHLLKEVFPICWPLRHAVSSCHIPSDTLFSFEALVWLWENRSVWKLWCRICLRCIMEGPEEGCGFSLPRALSSVPAEDLTNSFH